MIHAQARLHPDDTPTALIIRTCSYLRCVISATGIDGPLDLSFQSAGDARRWLEDAMDAINDAEKAYTRKLHPAARPATAQALHEIQREQYLEARYEAESEGALDYATTPRVMPS